MRVEAITTEALVQLRRHARLEKKKKWERLLNTKLRDVLEKWNESYSAFRAALSKSRTEPEGKAAAVCPGMLVLLSWQTSAVDRVSVLLS